MPQETEQNFPNLEYVAYAQLNSQQKKQRLKELVLVFSQLGLIAFGGPVAHIAMMEDEIVKNRQWITREKMLDLLGITHLIPGPNSTELAIHIGYERAGWRGLIIAGFFFILPAFLLVWLLAIIYVRYQSIPQVEGLLYGIKPVIIVIVLQALWKLGRKAIKDISTGITCIIIIGAFGLGINEVLLLILAGLGVMIIKNWGKSGIISSFLLPFSYLATKVNYTPEFSANWWRIFLFFLKVGSVLYGSGYVLLAFLQKDLVERTGWLQEQQLLDAIAIGQITPGPVFTTATFIGYLLAGNAGAIAGTVGIFLPAFILVGIINPWVNKLRQSPWTSGFLDGVNPASLGLMVVVTYTLGYATLIDSLTIILAVFSALGLFYFQVNSVWLILAGGVVGLLWQWFG
ncbi:chromate transporter [Aphanothece sacrum]|uniref:Chromate transporter n=1 Tax=Aphanothece sacrum FPU1 TaxID=1920663 RepID=A0A401IES5_APHSA|nr:chromate transporter [Aphanothece sacrum]GBF79773.1 chromate transporter [Aphanothece sacrum FPU1]GBF84785.1 chromate transporter [Aphanothece sacrum FPU3]